MKHGNYLKPSLKVFMSLTHYTDFKRLDADSLLLVLLFFVFFLILLSHCTRFLCLESNNNEYFFVLCVQIYNNYNVQ